jgi:hypothetical protein
MLDPRLEGDLAQDDAQRQLAEVLSLAEIELWFFDAEVLPPGSEIWGRDVDLPPWKVRARELAERTHASHELEWTDGGAWTRSAIFGNLVDAARADERCLAYSPLTRDEASNRRAADAVLAGAAHSVGVDILITRREYLHRATWQVARDVTVCTPLEALGLIALFLRSRGQYVVIADQGRATYSLGSSMFYLVAAWSLLPNGDLLRAAFATLEGDEDRDDDASLVHSIAQRLARALKLRDSLGELTNCSLSNSAIDEGLSQLDSCLLFLMGAMDSLARVVHHLGQLPAGRLRRAGWQNSDWLAMVESWTAEPGRLLSAGTEESAVFAILRHLRNTVHDAGLQAMTVASSSTPDRLVVRVPRKDVEVIMEAVDRLGGSETWKVERLFAGRLYIDPFSLIDELLPRVASLVNELMGRIVDAVDVAVNVKEGPWRDWDLWGERTKERVLRQLLLRGIDI